ncbi:hypothetical protein KY331_05130 [Candidatus Woesearchaeota archaeon]|nr:hypothetical protein [Candidatus Woesearchaeota archaeon]
MNLRNTKFVKIWMILFVILLSSVSALTDLEDLELDKSFENIKVLGVTDEQLKNSLILQTDDGGTDSVFVFVPNEPGSSSGVTYVFADGSNDPTVRRGEGWNDIKDFPISTIEYDSDVYVIQPDRETRTDKIRYEDAGPTIGPIILYNVVDKEYTRDQIFNQWEGGDYYREGNIQNPQKSLLYVEVKNKGGENDWVTIPPDQAAEYGEIGTGWEYRIGSDGLLFARRTDLSKHSVYDIASGKWVETDSARVEQAISAPTTTPTVPPGTGTSPGTATATPTTEIEKMSKEQLEELVVKGTAEQIKAAKIEIARRKAAEAAPAADPWEGYTPQAIEMWKGLGVPDGATAKELLARGITSKTTTDEIKTHMGFIELDISKEEAAVAMALEIPPDKWKDYTPTQKNVATAQKNLKDLETAKTKDDIAIAKAKIKLEEAQKVQEAEAAAAAAKKAEEAAAAKKAEEEAAARAAATETVQNLVKAKLISEELAKELTDPEAEVIQKAQTAVQTAKENLEKVEGETNIAALEADLKFEQSMLIAEEKLVNTPDVTEKDVEDRRKKVEDLKAKIKAEQEKVNTAKQSLASAQTAQAGVIDTFRLKKIDDYDEGIEAVLLKPERMDEVVQLYSKDTGTNIDKLREDIAAETNPTRKKILEDIKTQLQGIAVAETDGYVYKGEGLYVKKGQETGPTYAYNKDTKKWAQTTDPKTTTEAVGGAQGKMLEFYNKDHEDDQLTFKNGKFFDKNNYVVTLSRDGTTVTERKPLETLTTEKGTFTLQKDLQYDGIAVYADKDGKLYDSATQTLITGNIVKTTTTGSMIFKETTETKAGKRAKEVSKTSVSILTKDEEGKLEEREIIKDVTAEALRDIKAELARHKAEDIDEGTTSIKVGDQTFDAVTVDGKPIIGVREYDDEKNKINYEVVATNLITNPLDPEGEPTFGRVVTRGQDAKGAVISVGGQNREYVHWYIGKDGETHWLSSEIIEEYSKTLKAKGIIVKTELLDTTDSQLRPSAREGVGWKDATFKDWAIDPVTGQKYAFVSNYKDGRINSYAFIDPRVSDLLKSEDNPEGIIQLDSEGRIKNRDEILEKLQGEMGEMPGRPDYTYGAALEAEFPGDEKAQAEAWAKLSEYDRAVIRANEYEPTLTADERNQIQQIMDSGEADIVKTGKINDIISAASGRADEPEEILDEVESRARSEIRAVNFATMEKYLTEFQGLSYYSPHLFGEEETDAWKHAADQLFDNVVFGGTDYWASLICHHDFENDVGDESLYYVTPEGQIVELAHIEGERSSAITLPNGSIEYFYKITFFAKATYEDNEFNVYLTSDDYKDQEIYSENIELEGYASGDGEAFYGSGANAIVQYSTKEYLQACIRFKHGLQVGMAWRSGARKPKNELCNSIVEADDSYDNYLSSGSSGGGGTGDEDDDITINDI